MSATDAAELLLADAVRLADRTTAVHFAAHPDLESRWGAHGRARCVDDTIRHLQYLATAVRAQRPEVFTEYVRWVRSVLEGLGIGADDLRHHLLTLGDVLTQEHPGFAREVGPVIDAGRAALREDAWEPPDHIDGPHRDLARRYLDTILRGDRATGITMITDAVSGGVGVEDLYVHVFQPALREVGRLWQLNRITVAQEHFATAATQLAMSTLYPHIFGNRGPSQGRLLATCVGGELHEVGLRMLADIFELRGWDTHFIGANVPRGAVLAAVEAQDPDVVAISATLVPHIEGVRALIEGVRAIGRRRTIVVGGRPFLSVPELVQTVGADGTATDAVGAVDVVVSLVA